MIRTPQTLSRRTSSLGWLLSLVLVLGYVAWDSVANSRNILRTTAQYGVTVDAPPIDPGSPTGYADGRRSLLLPAGEADTAHWIMQTQTMIERGRWRFRHVDYDGAPTGREVHWAAPFHWWLIALAWVDRIASGRPIGISVERATLLSGPLMLGILLVGLIPFLARHFSAIAAVLVAVGTVAILPFYLDFMPARADHHGLANIFCLLAVLFLVVSPAAASAGAEKPHAIGTAYLTARRWVVASAISGGMGLWISAATAAPMLVALGVAVLAAGWIARRSAGRPEWMRDPALLRVWGWTGGLVSLAAYLVEYFPGHLGMRLEVNHPLYALAWIGAGELLRVLLLAMQENRESLTRREVLFGGIGLGAVVLLPSVILVSKETTFTVADPFMWRLHSLYISEFQGLVRYFSTKGLGWESVGFLLPMFLLLPPLLLAMRRTASADFRSQMVLAGIPAALGWAMGWSQLRWLSLAFAVSIPAIAVFFRNLETGSEPKQRSPWRWIAIASGLLLLPGMCDAIRRTLQSDESSQREIQSLAERDVAHWLRLRSGSERVVIAGAPMSTTKLISFGGTRVAGVGTLYWENVAGLKNAAALFAEKSPEAAHEAAMRLGVTHLVLFSWDAFEVVLAKMSRGLTEDASIPADLFIANLLKAPVPPPWLRAIPFKLPSHPSLEGSQVRIWELTAELSPAEAVAHAANYFLELGAMDVAAQFTPLLSKYPESLPAVVMQAAIASRRRDAPAFSVALQQIGSRLAQTQTLALDDHLNLVIVLAVADRTDLARNQLVACLRKIDERSLRRLSAGALSDLLALSEAFAVELPSAELTALAQRLLPPAKRSPSPAR